MILFILCLITTIFCQEYIYSPSDIIDYINNRISYTKEDYQSFIDNLSKSLSDAYAFNDISKNPPQPNFNFNYHKKVDIQKELNEMNLNDIKPYEFYREIWLILSKLKDQHIQIKWKPLNLDKFFILGPIEYSIKEDENGKPKIFGQCLDNSQLEDFDNGKDISDICQYYSDTEIIKINDIDPFEYINNFGGDFLATKNIHGTFSFKLRYHNNVPLSDYPLSLEELQNYEAEFISGESFKTEYLIISDVDIDNDDNDRLRNLNGNNNKIHKKKIIKYDNLLYIKKSREKDIQTFKKIIGGKFNWDYECEDILKCSADEINQVNIYYISSFTPSNKNNFNKTLENCYKLFDDNIYPIIVINDLNNGGLVSFSQLFLGILSPLVPIRLYNGRIRVSEVFNETKEINEYINLNLTKIEDCSNCTYNDLIEKEININYGNNINSTLTELFYINNHTIYNNIENARNNMNNKRKPTEILIYTDGYSFSAASLYIKYLKENGGGIITSYLGNPNKPNEIFDISQSPSPVFTSSIIQIFSDHYNTLLSENECELQFPGIQTFYNSSNVNIPLEYEISVPDEKSEIYEYFDENNYQKFVDKAKTIFEKYINECNPENKNLLKITEECDNKFDNNYTHGGYECGNDGKWSNICMPSYCDIGYTFDKTKKKCIKEVCSSFDVPNDNEKENEKENENKEENEIENEEENIIEEEINQKFYSRKEEKQSDLVFYIALPVGFVFLLTTIIYIIIYRFKHFNNNYFNSEKHFKKENVYDRNNIISQ